MALYIGLMSGTSMDGINAALVDLGGSRPHVVATHSQSIPAPLRADLELLVTDTVDDIRRVWRADADLGDTFAEAALALLERAGVSRDEVVGIGSHGQTIYHAPDANPPVTIQIGDPNRIAERTGISTVADFRRRDIAAGGQGAPLAPAFHAAVFATRGAARGILNLGGIANLTLLPASPDGAILGFDTGPANTLLDAWCLRHLGTPFDHDGAWASGGRTHGGLLAACLDDPYFRRPPPKSTGREHFNLRWLADALNSSGSVDIDPRDVQRTLCELSATAVARAQRTHAAAIEEVLVCGGGALNPVLMSALAEQLAPIPIATTDAAGIPPLWVEAAAFAWLAMRTLSGQPGNVPSVTGAARPVTLGGIYPGR